MSELIAKIYNYIEVNKVSHELAVGDSIATMENRNNFTW